MHAGHPDDDFVTMIKSKKGKILSVCGKITSFLDKNPVESNGKQFIPKLFVQQIVIFSQVGGVKPV